MNRKIMNKICIYITCKNEKLSHENIKLLNFAVQLAKKMKVKLDIIAISNQQLTSHLFSQYNEIDNIFVFDCKCYMQFNVLIAKEVITNVLKNNKYTLILINNTQIGQELAFNISKSISQIVITDCKKITFNKKQLKIISINQNNNKTLLETDINIDKISCTIATIICDNKTDISKSIKKHNNHKIIELLPNDSLIEDYKKMIITEKIFAHNNKSTNLKESKIIIGIGRGVKNKQNLNKINELANLINANIGATRGAIDIGIANTKQMIGTTGITVNPNIYITFGISGCIHHIVGINKEHCTIISINSDQYAPIFSISDYGIIGKIEDIIPKIIKTIQLKLNAIKE